MALNRRGFLGALGALAAAVAVDPERLLWRPKLISIPPVVRRPELRQFCVDIAVNDADWRNVDRFHQRYVIPALASLAASVDAWVLREGRRDPVFVPLELPVGLQFARRVDLGRRVVGGYDIVDNRMLTRVDCLVYA